MPLVSPRTDTDHFPFQFPLHQKCRCAGNERVAKEGRLRAVLPPMSEPKDRPPALPDPAWSPQTSGGFPCLFSRLFPKNPHTLHNMSGLLRPKSPFAPSKESSSSKADRAVQTAYLQNGSAGSVNTTDSCRARFFRNQVKGPDSGLNITIPWEQVKKNLLPDRVRRRLPGINQYLRPVCQHILPSVFIWLYDDFLSGWCLQNHCEHIGIVFHSCIFSVRSYSPMISSSVSLSLCRLPDNPSARELTSATFFSSCPDA